MTLCPSYQLTTDHPGMQQFPQLFSNQPNIPKEEWPFLLIIYQL